MGLRTLQMVHYMPKYVTSLYLFSFWICASSHGYHLSKFWYRLSTSLVINMVSPNTGKRTTWFYSCELLHISYFSVFTWEKVRYVSFKLSNRLAKYLFTGFFFYDQTMKNKILFPLWLFFKERVIHLLCLE